MLRLALTGSHRSGGASFLLSSFSFGDHEVRKHMRTLKNKAARLFGEMGAKMMAYIVCVCRLDA